MSRQSIQRPPRKLLTRDVGVAADHGDQRKQAPGICDVDLVAGDNRKVSQRDGGVPRTFFFGGAGEGEHRAKVIRVEHTNLGRGGVWDTVLTYCADGHSITHATIMVDINILQHSRTHVWRRISRNGTTI